MSWREDKNEKLQKSRDFSFLNDGAGQKVEGQRQKKVKLDQDGAADKMHQDSRDRLLRLKALEKQKSEKQKPRNHIERSMSDERQEAEKNPVSIGNKRVLPYDQKFGSFFGRPEKVVAKRVLDEQRAREISSRASKQAEAERPRAKVDTRKASDPKKASKPGSNSGNVQKPAPKRDNSTILKVKKLQEARDYAFLFSNEPSKPASTGERERGRTDSRPEPKKQSKDVRDYSLLSSDGPNKFKASTSQTMKSKEGGLSSSRPSLEKLGLPTTARKPDSNKPSTVEERDRSAKDLRQESKRQTMTQRSERERSLVPSRSSLPSSNKSSSHSGPASRGVPSEPPRGSRALQRKLVASVTPKATNHDRPISKTSRDYVLDSIVSGDPGRRAPVSFRDGALKKPMSETRLSQTSVMRSSQTTVGNANSQNRVIQKSTSETRVTQGTNRGSQYDAATTKRKSLGEPSRRPTVTSKDNNGRRVDRSRYEDSGSESEDDNCGDRGLKKIVSGGPRISQSAGQRGAQSSVGVKRKLVDERRGRSVPLKENKRKPAYSDSDSGAESDGGGNRGGISSIIQKLFGYNPDKYKDIDDEDDRNMETSFRHIQAEERRSAKLAREEDEREQEALEREEREEKLRKLKKQKSK